MQSKVKGFDVQGVQKSQDKLRFQESVWFSPFLQNNTKSWEQLQCL